MHVLNALKTAYLAITPMPVLNAKVDTNWVQMEPVCNNAPQSAYYANKNNHKNVHNASLEPSLKITNVF